MSKLNFIGRPWVVFDPYNRQHRRWYNDSQKLKTWGQCPVRFVVSDDSGDLLAMIQRQLIQYYIVKEFGTTIKNKGRDEQKSRAKQVSVGV